MRTTNILVKRVHEDKMTNSIEDLIVEGYRVKNRGNDIAIMERPGKYGSLLLHLILLLFTAGLGNIIYAYLTYTKTKSIIHLKTEDS